MTLQELLGIEHNIILAPMFLVSNVDMTKAALDVGITAAIPALNYRSIESMHQAIEQIKDHSGKPFGINLIVSKSNIYLKNQLAACLEYQVDYIITGLGNPVPIVNACKGTGIKVIADVASVHHARKAVSSGVDAIIALNDKAGGHLGSLSSEEFIPALQKEVQVPIISAGGVGNRQEYKQMMSHGIAGCSIGSIFIASTESPVHQDYKDAIVQYGEKDIIITKKLSGTPCSIINTPYVQSISQKENFAERLMHLHPKVKKWIKTIMGLRGLQQLRKAANEATYKNVWAAGKSIESVDKILPISEIVNNLTSAD